MKIKTMLQGVVLFACIGPSVYYLVTGPKGFQKYRMLKREVLVENNNIAQLTETINQMQTNIDTWNNTPFEREKIARQDLSMSFTNELVFLTPNMK